MFKVVRQSKIKEIVMDRNQVDVQTLSSMLNVSSVTIRNDLEALEEQGFLVRTHGGAVLNDSGNQEKSLTRATPDWDTEYDKYRDSIAQIAAHLVGENEWVFLGPGATCGLIAKSLTSRSRLSVVTNNLYAAAALSANAGTNVIVTGGNLCHEGMYLSGELFNLSLGNIHVSKAFFSVAGVDLKNGYSVSSSAELSIYTQIKAICDQLILLADYRKFGVSSFMRIGSLNSAGTLISNENIPSEYKEYFFDHSTKLFTSYEIRPSSVQGKL